MEHLTSIKSQKLQPQSQASFKRMYSSRMQTTSMCSFTTRKNASRRRRSVRARIVWVTQRLDLKECWVSGASVLEWGSNKFRNSSHDQLFWHQEHCLLLIHLRQSCKLSLSRSLRILTWYRLNKCTSQSCQRVRAASSSTLLSKIKTISKWWTSLERPLQKSLSMCREGY